ncbi:MAG: hypothetical protein ACRD03_02970 [Acidimicrobiales bacterium]
MRGIPESVAPVNHVRPALGEEHGFRLVLQVDAAAPTGYRLIQVRGAQRDKK